MSAPLQSADAYHYDSSTHGITQTRLSANEIVKWVIATFHPESVVDFGCGLGDWLAAFQQAGCARVLGLDGAWVPESHLQIPLGSFKRVELTAPIRLTDRFDLAISFEVAERY
jgi:2-polyprenyl-3-methyl-5-hydroxy-6-metoxy-1,4-benzoquinol methylase